MPLIETCRRSDQALTHEDDHGPDKHVIQEDNHFATPGEEGDKSLVQNQRNYLHLSESERCESFFDFVPSQQYRKRNYRAPFHACHNKIRILLVSQPSAYPHFPFVDSYRLYAWRGTISELENPILPYNNNISLFQARNNPSVKTE